MMNEREVAKANKRKAVIIAVILIAAVGFFGFRNGGIFRSKKAVISDVRGLSYDEAVEKIDRELRKAGIRNAQFIKGWIDGGPSYELLVTTQDPKAGTVVRKGDSVTVYLYVGEGWYTKMPHAIKYEFEEGIEECFTQMPVSACCWETVELRTHVLADADIHVYVDGNEIEKTHSDSDYWGYTFTMGMNNVVVTAKWYTQQETEEECYGK